MAAADTGVAWGMEGLLFNTKDGYNEGIVRGLKSGLLSTQDYANLKDKLIRAEREILKELGFILYSEHPHKFILNYVKLLAPSKEQEHALAQATG